MAFAFSTDRLGRAWRLGQGNELVVVDVGQLHSPGLPVRLGLIDPLARGGHEVPFQVAGPERLASGTFSNLARVMNMKR